MADGFNGTGLAWSKRPTAAVEEFLTRLRLADHCGYDQRHKLFWLRYGDGRNENYWFGWAGERPSDEELCAELGISPR